MRVSVRAMVESVLLQGDIAPGNALAMLEGMRGHKRLQGEYGQDAVSEVTLRREVRGRHIALTVHGRADVVWMREGLPAVLEEIKTTRRDPASIGEADYPLHWAQAECYAHMLCEAHGLPGMAVRLTYAQAGGVGEARLTREYTVQALKKRFDELTGAYIHMLEAGLLWQRQRDQSIREMNFPYQGYRRGQRQMAAKAYLALRDGNHLFCEAPTGIGKTAAMLFSSLKAMGEGHVGKVFYLTARGTTRAAAQEALSRMRQTGLSVRSVALTAKDKICPHPGCACAPDSCPRAKGHYDRLRAAMDKALEQRQDFDAAALSDIAAQHNLCPFELGLDISLHCDVVIGDYNYAFDPFVRLKRYFLAKSDACLLIDEAHNLPDRAREMFSSQIEKRNIQALRRQVGQVSRKDEIYVALSGVLSALKNLRGDAGDEVSAGEYPEELCDAVSEFAICARERLNDPAPYQEALLERFFEATAFEAAAASMKKRSDCFTALNDPASVRLYCLDPAPLLGEVLGKVKAAVFFSATLSPLPYYARLCGPGEDAEVIALPSPFPAENLKVLLCPVATRYSQRDATASQVAAAIAAMAGARRDGSYFAFFPSYAYLRQVVPLVAQALPAAQLIVQRPGMDEDARADFLAQFPLVPDGVRVAFAVMGGLFGEGIDLPGDRLSGCAIVGVGLPQIGVEREVLRAHFEEEGFAYAYVYPGMTKVVQAAGRVIRKEDDRGVLLLIDERFAVEPYTELLPPHWQAEHVKGPRAIARMAGEFWKQEVHA